MKTHAIVSAILLFGLLQSSVYPQKGVPNLSGTWKLNPAKSLWDGTGVLAYRIKQKGNKILVEIAWEGGVNRLEYVADGTARIAGFDPNSKTSVTTRASWQGRDLVLVSQFQSGSMPELTSRFSLSADGKTLTVRRTMGDTERTLAFDKQ